MNESLVHWIVRLIVVINLAITGLDFFYDSFAHWAANGPLGSVLTIWLPFTALLLPAYVGFEIFRIKKLRGNSSAAWTDGAFALLWFLVFCLALGHTFTHHVPF